MLQGNAGLILFIATIFLSAFLLFALEPLFAKMVLPVLGGSSSVWAVALLFFQGALLAGYAYVDLLFRWAPFKWTGPVHIALALLAIVVLPIGLPSGWTEPPPGEPYFWQLGLFRPSRSACRSSRSPPTPHCCRRGLHAADILTRTTCTVSYPLLKSRQPRGAAELPVRAGTGLRPDSAQPLLERALSTADRSARTLLYARAALRS